MLSTTAICLAVIYWACSCHVFVVEGLTCSDVNCNFQSDLCKWSSSEGDDYNREWTRKSNQAYLDIDRNKCGILFISPPCPSNYTGRLTSPLLEAQPGYDCLLSFQFNVPGNSDKCRLTLYQKNNDSGTETALWTHMSSDSPASVRINCSSGGYELRFDGERTDGSSNACTNGKHEITLDDINCKVTDPSQTTSIPTSSTAPSTQTPSCTSQTSLTATTSNSQTTTSPSSSPSEAGNVTAATLMNADKGPSAGAIAGIVVAVIIVIAIAVVVIVFVLRRRKLNDKPPGSASPDYVNTRPRAEGISGGRANPAYELDTSVTSRVNGNASNYSEANYESTASGGYELASTRQPARGEYHSSSPDPYSHLSRGGARNGPGVDDTYDHTQTAGAANGENAYSLAKVPREKDIARKPRNAASNYTNVEAPDGDDYNHLGEPIPDPTTTPTTEYSMAKPLPSHSPSGEAAAIYEVAGTTDYEAVNECGNLMTSLSASSGKPMTSPSVPSDDYYSGLDLKGEKKAKQGDLGYLHNYDHARDPAALNADDYNVLDVDDSRSRDQQRNVAADEYSHV